MQPDKSDYCLPVSSLNSEGRGKVVYFQEEEGKFSIITGLDLRGHVDKSSPPCSENTEIQHKGPRPSKRASSILWPRRSEHYSQEPRCTHRLRLHHASHSETTHTFTIAITWYILLIILIIADLDLREARLNNARTIQHKHAADWGLVMRVNVRYTMFRSS